MRVGDCITPSLILRINKILSATGAVCVLSSSWREYDPKEWIQSHLEIFGFAGKIIDCTPSLPARGYNDDDIVERSDEIKSWIRSNDSIDIESYVVIDDTIEADLKNGSFVKTTEAIGLTDDNVKKAIEILNEPAKPFHKWRI